MIFDKKLKSDAETLAREYVNCKSETRRAELEEKIVKRIERYARSYFFGYQERCMGNYTSDLDEDFAQCVRIGILEALRSYDPKRGKFLTWVIWKVRPRLNQDDPSSWITIPGTVVDDTRIYRKHLRNFREANGRNPSVEETASELGWKASKVMRVKEASSVKKVAHIGEPDSESFSIDPPDPTPTMVNNALLSLPEYLQDYVRMHYIEGYSAEEISELQGVPVSTVWYFLKKAKSQLKELMFD